MAVETGGPAGVAGERIHPSRGGVVGIDVGGTFTDAVYIREGRVDGYAKYPTDPGNVFGSVLGALDALGLGSREGDRIARGDGGRIVVSTTLCTNAIVSGNHRRVAAVIMPGPGLGPEDLRKALGGGFEIWPVRGYIDHRGREVEPLREDESRGVLSEISRLGYGDIAVVGKFSIRNPSHEKAVARLSRDFVTGHVTMGHEMSGMLNFPRRVATACLNSAVACIQESFVDELQKALAERGFAWPSYVLKADGGTMPIRASARAPVETILSGPAASVIGAMSLEPGIRDAVIVDIGGTTTDVSFVVNGSPLFEPHGAVIGGRRTLVRALYSRSCALGGDNEVSAQGVIFGPRSSPAAFGGPSATLTDALVVLGLADAGDRRRAGEAIERLASRVGVSGEELCGRAVDSAVDHIESFVTGLIDSLRSSPIYTVRELLRGAELKPRHIVGIGAPAAALVPAVARRLGLEPRVPRFAAIGNAVGAALATPTVGISLHIDTREGYVAVSEEGLREPISAFFGSATLMPDERAVREAAFRLLARRVGVDSLSSAEAEMVEYQAFNLVRGFRTVGRVIDVRVQTRPGYRRLAEEVVG